MMERYKDRCAPIDSRVDDLLSRMTLNEKIGQLNQRMFGWQVFRKINDQYEFTEEFIEEISFGNGIGALYGLFRADPWSGVTLENGYSLEDCPQLANRIQRYVMENTRLGIPVLLSEECPHGHQALYGTMLPNNLGVGATWNPELYQRAFSHVAAEIRSRGAHLGLVSSLDILRDGRWGRSEECYSEDPYLASSMTAAVVKGMQGTEVHHLSQPDKVIAVLKHFCAQGACVGGHNAWPASIGERELREIFLPGMKAGIMAGAIACMAAYNEIDGIPCHANRKLLTDILREEMGFSGFVMSDGKAVDMLLQIAGDFETAAAMAVQAGVDLNLWNNAFLHLEAAVKEGKIQEYTIDHAVRRVLRAKFLIGLFEDPFVDDTLVTKVVGNPATHIVNLQLARESVVLLNNRNGLLPLPQDLRRIAVIGPNADAIYNQLGDYTSPQPKGAGVTVLQGIQSMVSDGTTVIYHRGCGIRDMSRDEFTEAVQAANEADVVIVAVGGSSARGFQTEFADNGAAKVNDGRPPEMDCGEGVDVADLALGGLQVELIQALVATGTPVVVVLIQGRPHAIPWIAEHCDSVLCAWYPGMEGGKAIADVLFGKFNPCGKLPVSIPRSSMQLPVYYNHKDVHLPSYVDMPSAPLYPFGFGLSYTTFEYSSLRVERESVSLRDLNEHQSVQVAVDVQNTGKRSGQAVVQLYIKGLEGSVTRRNRELKGFKKVYLEPGEKKALSFNLGQTELAIWNAQMQFVVEPGFVAVFVGADATADMSARFEVVT